MYKTASKTLGILSLTAAIALAGCSTVNPYTGEKQTSDATKGAGAGAVAGALLGLATGHDAKSRRKNALIGAGVGAAAGGGIGYYMDVQEAKLRQQLQATGVSVTRNGNNIVLNMPGNITFMTNSSNVSANAKNVLNSVSLVLKEYSKTNIVVAGYTDNTGSDNYNQMLSQQRAQSVANVLMDDGVAHTRLRVQGYGEANPIASNGTPEGRAENRRVELTLIPTEQE
jgi:outer membrane protein OmpA-like peptidoglycan-associated protein